jgi:serine/threonine protein kinase
MMLHKNHIVHADIKKQNILVKKTKKNSLTAKIVDFDCSFVEKLPPETEDELKGDQVYFSPEACLFLCGEETRLTSKLDVFALGILFHQYLTGELPGFDSSEYDYLHEAVLDDQPARISPQIMEPFRTMIARMLLVDPDQRCSMEEVWENLMPMPCRKYLEAKNNTGLGSEPREITRGGFVLGGDL